MMNLMGLPHSDTPYLLELADGIVRGQTDDARRQAFGQVFRYMGEQVIPLRRAARQGGWRTQFNQPGSHGHGRAYRCGGP